MFPALLTWCMARPLSSRQTVCHSRTGLVNPISHINNVDDVNFHALFSALPSCVGFALCDRWSREQWLFWGTSECHQEYQRPAALYDCWSLEQHQWAYQRPAALYDWWSLEQWLSWGTSETPARISATRCPLWLLDLLSNTSENISDRLPSMTDDLLSNDSLEEHQNTSENISDPLVQLATPSNVFGCKHVTSSGTELVEGMARNFNYLGVLELAPLLKEGWDGAMVAMMQKRFNYIGVRELMTDFPPYASAQLVEKMSHSYNWAGIKELATVAERRMGWDYYFQFE